MTEASTREGGGASEERPLPGIVDDADGGMSGPQSQDVERYAALSRDVAGLAAAVAALDAKVDLLLKAVLSSGTGDAVPQQHVLEAPPPEFSAQEPPPPRHGMRSAEVAGATAVARPRSVAEDGSMIDLVTDAIRSAGGELGLGELAEVLGCSAVSSRLLGAVAELVRTGRAEKSGDQVSLLQ